jgi:hypothetical protein
MEGKQMKGYLAIVVLGICAIAAIILLGNLLLTMPRI